MASDLLSFSVSVALQVEIHEKKQIGELQRSRIGSAL